MQSAAIGRDAAEEERWCSDCRDNLKEYILVSPNLTSTTEKSSRDEDSRFGPVSCARRDSQ